MALLDMPSNYQWSVQGQQTSQFQDWMNEQRSKQQQGANTFLSNRQPYYGQMYQGMMQAGTPAIQDQYNQSMLKNKYAGASLGQLGGSDDWRRQGAVSTMAQGQMGDLNAKAQAMATQQEQTDMDSALKLKLASLMPGAGDASSAQALSGLIGQQGQGQEAYNQALMQQMQQQLAMGNATSAQYGQYLTLLANSQRAANDRGSYY